MDNSVIERLRMDKGFEKKDVIEKIGYSYQGYKKLIRSNDIKVSILEQIADLMEVDICYFFQQSLYQFHEPTNYQLNDPDTDYGQDTLLLPRDTYNRLVRQLEVKDQQISVLNEIIKEKI